jgi:uncharacterized membrane protein
VKAPKEISSMETLPLHPKLVHLPIALAVLMPLISGGLLLAWWRDWLPRRAWWLAVALQGLLLASGLAARSTGEEDEERVEKVVPHDAIEEHEEAATGFLIGGGVTLALALGAALVRRREGLARGVAAATVVATLVTMWLGFRVGEAGGRLVYQYGAGAAFSAGGTKPGADGPAEVPAAGGAPDRE